MTVWQETIARRLRALHFDVVVRRLRALHLESIRNQMLVFAVVATLAPALAVAIVSHRQNRQSIGDQIAQELRGGSAEAATRRSRNRSLSH